MNANELADKLTMLRLYEWQDFSVPVKPADFHQEAATMLRQLQAENELLQAKLNYMFEQELKSAKVSK